MTFVKKLISLPYYQNLLQQLSELEQHRLYCKHDYSHFLNVARIAAILVRDYKLNVSDETIYLTALLHDLGRIYDGPEPHALASVRYAKECLSQIDYPKEKWPPILNAIADHRYRGKKAPENFTEAFSLADNLSRSCYCCPVSETCKWPDERKNHTLIL